MGAAAPTFHPIAGYGFLSDGRTGALVAPDGAVEWLCLPRFDAPSVFGAILDREAGAFRFAPKRMRVPLATRYIPGTIVLETTWMTESGDWVVVHEALAIAVEGEPEGMLIRCATCTWGEVEMEMICDPMLEYGAKPARWTQDREGAMTCDVPDVEWPMRLAGIEVDGIDDGAVKGSHRMKRGESCFCALAWDEAPPPKDTDEAARRVDATVNYWRRWLERGSFPDHPWRIHLQRSALTLKGLVYEPTGALIAALTTSLPEAPGGERNWDYRFSWVRDSTFALWGLHILGFNREAFAFMGFIASLFHEQGPDPQIMFGINGERELTERTIPHLGGYKGAKPVRVGNGAWDQRQNDVYGMLLDSVYIHTRARRERLPDNFWRIVSDQVDGAVGCWRDPDRGIWEVRGEPQHFVSSKLMCWVAMDRGVRLAKERGESDEVERWSAEADACRAELLDRGVSERGVFRQHYETGSLDASTLWIPRARVLPPNDERVRDTVLAISDELTENGFVLRYKVDETDDGLSGKEGTFTICSFWLVSALSEIGERKRAKDLCQSLLAHASHLNLFAEELEADSGLHLGNFPQAFTHLSLINAVAHVISDDERGERRRTAVFSELRSGAADPLPDEDDDAVLEMPG
ncbi:MAG: glycoside hydrolase family 15 protein [Solirubrobacterales bacterium]